MTMNIVSKNITTLPSEICNIIYEYYKLPFLDEIKRLNDLEFSPSQVLDSWFGYYGFNYTDNEWRSKKVQLITSLLRSKDMLYKMPRVGMNLNRLGLDRVPWVDQITNRNSYKYYEEVDKFFEYMRYGILFEKSVIPPNSAEIVGLNSRNDYKRYCRNNGIEFKEKTPTKTLVKKLMRI